MASATPLRLLALAPAGTGEFTTFWQPSAGYVRRSPDGAQGPAIDTSGAGPGPGARRNTARQRSSWRQRTDPALREQLRAYQRA